MSNVEINSDVTASVQCLQCEQLAREHSEAIADLWALNKTYGIGVQSKVASEQQASEDYQVETLMLRAAHERCGKVRSALMEHRRSHGF